MKLPSAQYSFEKLQNSGIYSGEYMLEKAQNSQNIPRYSQIFPSFFHYTKSCNIN